MEIYLTISELDETLHMILVWEFQRSLQGKILFSLKIFFQGTNVLQQKLCLLLNIMIYLKTSCTQTKKWIKITTQNLQTFTFRCFLHLFYRTWHKPTFISKSKESCDVTSKWLKITHLDWTRHLNGKNSRILHPLPTNFLCVWYGNQTQNHWYTQN